MATERKLPNTGEDLANWLYLCVSYSPGERGKVWGEYIEAWADSRVQAALAPLRADLEAATNELTEIHKIVGGDGEWVAEDVQEGVRAALRDMERQRDEQREKLEATNG